MSLLSDLPCPKGSRHKKKRVGRGDGSNWGGTSGKGHKGQKARSGGKIRMGFEGGQMPLQRRLPKFGFKNTAFSKNFVIINLEQLNGFDGEVNPTFLKDRGFLKKSERLKILGRGSVEKPLTIKAHSFSKSARQAIEQAGGKVEVVD